MEREILSKIEQPDDVKKLREEELLQLCAEIRSLLVETVAKNGGHLASNLGVVELTVALHYVFKLPEDKIVWDVGHQCYTHKILTGRREGLTGIRTRGGISGFPKRSESEYDAFGTGHSSTAISAALGLDQANRLLGRLSKVVAVVGDGALSGGLAFEGLNNAGRLEKNFIVVLNDNKMSISHNVGSMARYLAKIRMMPRYLKVKSDVKKAVLRLPVVGKSLHDLIFKSKAVLKNVLYDRTIFEDMGFVYYGPVDGHDLGSLLKVFGAASLIDRPVFVHVNTQKGKGYRFAEKDPRAFHGLSGFDIKTGGQRRPGDDFSEIFGRKLLELAENDKKICAVTAAMKIGTGLLEFSQKFADRFFDVGIAEGHAVTFSAGLAAGGMVPVFAVYSSFLQRGYDQIVHDAATQNLHVVLAVDRAGVVGEDGETHQGVFDVAFLNAVPGVSIFAPAFFDELKDMLNVCIYKCKGVAVLRYPRGSELLRPSGFKSSGAAFDVFGDQGTKIALVTYGRLFSFACVAKERLQCEHGLDVCVFKLNRIKPLDERIFALMKGFERVYFFEEGMLCGGVAEHFGNVLASSGCSAKFAICAIDGEFVQQGTVEETLRDLGLDAKGMVDRILA